MKNIKIAGSGYAIPEHCISNQDLEASIDTSDEWIVSRTGIQTRYISEHENTSDLGYRAATQAIKDAQIEASEIDLIIVATFTPDHFTPSCACLVQEKLGLNGARVMAYDINAACSGFVYAFQIACCMMQEYKCALIIGSETISKLIDWNDRNTCVLFGDGAGAMIIKRCESAHRIEHFAQSIGDNKGILQAGGISMGTPLKNIDKSFSYLQMDGSEVFRFAVKAMQEAMEEVMIKAGVTIDDIDLIVPHQANIRIIRNVAKRMKIKEDKFYVNLDKYGNTSAASVAIAFAQAKEERRIQAGMNILIVGFGAGFTYGASFIQC